MHRLKLPSDIGTIYLHVEFPVHQILLLEMAVVLSETLQIYGFQALIPSGQLVTEMLHLRWNCTPNQN